MAMQPKPLDKMQSAIQLSAFHYIVCLKALPTNADSTLAFEDTEFHFDSIRTADSNALHWEFQRWAASAVLRDIIENFSIFLMEIFRDAAADAPGRKFSKTLSDFERMGIEGQLSILQREFPISVEWVTRLTGYNRARNCLAHRAGVVGSLDTTDSNELVIRWLVAKLAVTEGIPNDSVDVKGPMNNLVLRQLISGDLAMSVALLDREKRVSAGSSLHFLPSEVLEICQTFQLASAAFSTIAAR